jgi:hypothetical protein
MIYVDCDILSADSIDWSYPDVTLRDRALYNRDGNTFMFDVGTVLKVTQVRLIDFDKLSTAMRELISVHALIEFCANQKMPEPADAQKRLTQAEMRAMQEDTDKRNINLMNSSYMRRIMGRSGSNIPWR